MVFSGNKTIAISLLHYCMNVKSNMALYCYLKWTTPELLGSLTQVPSSFIAFLNGEASPAWDALLMSSNKQNWEGSRWSSPLSKMLGFESEQLSTVLLQLWTKIVHVAAKNGHGYIMGIFNLQNLFPQNFVPQKFGGIWYLKHSSHLLKALIRPT